MMNRPQSLYRALFSVALSVLLSSMASAAPPREIGGAKQLFIDEDIVRTLSEVEFTLNPARRAERVLHATDPWAAAGLGFVNVIQQGGEFRMWYEVWTYVEQIPGHWMSRLCYAVSKDGIHWTKPRLGQVEFEGSGRKMGQWNLYFGSDDLSLRAGGLPVFPDADALRHR